MKSVLLVRTLLPSFPFIVDLKNLP